MKNMKFEFVQINFMDGYPKGKNIYYRCLICEDIIFSSPDHFDTCSCQNITIDTTCGRMSVDEKHKIEVLKKVKS
jgi:ribosomal protein S27E